MVRRRAINNEAGLQGFRAVAKWRVVVVRVSLDLMDQRRVVVLTDESTQGALDFAEGLRVTVGDRVEVVNLWVGDPHLAPVWARVQQRTPFGPAGLLYVALPRDYYRVFLACAAQIDLSGLRSSVVVDPVGFTPGTFWAGEVPVRPAFRFARDISERAAEVSALPDVWDLGVLDRYSLFQATKALSIGCLPPALSVGCAPIEGFVQPVGEGASGCLLMFDEDVRGCGLPPLRVLPGGYIVDEAVIRVARELILDHEGDPADLPDPYGSGLEEFLDFAESPEEEWRGVRGRIWSFLWEARPDLRENFPLPEGKDVDGFDQWCRSRLLEEPGTGLFRGFGQPYGRRFSPTLRGGRRGGTGLNLVGYLSSVNSQGGVARQVLGQLREAHIDVAAIDYTRLPSPKSESFHFPFAGAPFDTNLLFLGPDVFFNEYFQAREIFQSRRNVGYWFWELEQVPQMFLKSSSLVDRVLAPTRFVADSFVQAFDCPVDYVPLPVPAPPDAASVSPLAAFAHRPIFLTVFDYFSTEARKNPEGAIRAFLQAFPDSSDGPVLVVKSLNGHNRADGMRRLKAAAEKRRDVVFVDEVWSDSEVSAAIRDAACVVSLHRAEGLGLPPLEAVWLETPSITTSYGGILDYRDLTASGNSAPMRFVGYVPTEVARGENIYAEGAAWAEPDIEEASCLMKDLISGTWTPDTVLGRQQMAQRYEANVARLVASVRSLFGT